MPKIEIRPAISTDIPELVQINHHGQTDYVWPVNQVVNEGEITIQFRECAFRARCGWVSLPCLGSASQLEGPGRPAGGLPGRREAVGYIGLSDDHHPSTAWVTDLVVAPEFRRQGIATALLLAAQNWGIQRRLREMQLGVQSKNYPAIRLAVKLGFDFCGYNDHYYSSQDIALFFTRFL